MKALPVQCDYSAGTDVGRGSLETTMLDITCLTRDEWNYPELLLLWELSDPRIAELLLNKKTTLDVWAYPGVKPLDMPISGE